MICDSYIGFDTRLEVVLEVEDANHAVEITNGELIPLEISKIPLTKDATEEDEISEPEEESLAGQMNALKGGAGAAPPKKRKTPVREEESSGSDTDGDMDESDETNTVSTLPLQKFHNEAQRQSCFCWQWKSGDRDHDRTGTMLRDLLSRTLKTKAEREARHAGMDSLVYKKEACFSRHSGGVMFD